MRGENIREIRKRTGLSQSQFRAGLKIPIRTLQKSEIGERSYPDYVAELIVYRVQHAPIFSAWEYAGDSEP